MDVISFSEAATANSRIEIINANPDSSSGIVTVPKVIESTETITIPAGRVAVLPNVQIDGVLNIEGEVFIPSGSTFGDLENQLALKANLASPAFTGNPTAPTQTAEDNSIKLATTAWSKLGLTYSLGTNGYIKFPNWLGGLTIQWGSVLLSANSGQWITYPISFPNAVLVASASPEQGAGQGNVAIVSKEINRIFVHNQYIGSAAANYIVIGY